VTLVRATFKAARTIVRGPVTSFIREPLVEEPEGGFQQALAELVTCTRCTGTWVRQDWARPRSWLLASGG